MPSSRSGNPPRQACARRIARRVFRIIFRALAILALVFAGSGGSSAYSVLTHEEVVDLVWPDHIRPLLLKKYPGLTDDQIKEAHAYAYGGAVIQDLGYYPFGSKEFSDLVHYVRSGDFVRELLDASADADEYAFALGALAHYVSDNTGHPIAVNQAVPIEFPKLRKKYGNSVTYDEDESAHLETEFGFDMLQVAKNRYPSEQYHDFIGFQVSKPLLERAFPVVYGLELREVLTHEDLAIGTYRFAVSRAIPKMTQVALQTRKKEMVREYPDFAKKEFLYRLSRTNYEKEWGKDYTKPGFGTRLIAFFLRLVPKIGPFKALAFKNPTPQTEDLYFKSVDLTVDRYRALLNEVATNSAVLPNCDLDDGEPTRAGEYQLADDTYSKWLGQLSSRNFVGTTPNLRANILNFYSGAPGTLHSKKDEQDWQKVQLALAQLKALPNPSAAQPLSPATVCR